MRSQMILSGAPAAGHHAGAGATLRTDHYALAPSASFATGR